jgi:hypothetical protein
MLASHLVKLNPKGHAVGPFTSLALGQYPWINDGFEVAMMAEAVGEFSLNILTEKLSKVI